MDSFVVEQVKNESCSILMKTQRRNEFIYFDCSHRATDLDRRLSSAGIK
jgi:hypothetical protein